MTRLFAIVISAWLLCQPAMAAYLPYAVQFGGNGTDGPVVKSGTVTGPEFLDATSFTVSGTYSCDSGTRINATNNVVISGTVNVGYSVDGSPATSYPANLFQTSSGGGPGGGMSASSAWNGGNGAGFGGKGGRGGSVGQAHTFTRLAGGNPYSPFMFPGGSAGGSGAYAEGNLSGTGGKGGSAGGTLRITSAKSVTISGQINLNGGSGGNAVDAGYGASGGGGGSGGLALIAAMESISVSGTNAIQVKGGTGGDGTGSTGSAGGGGGGGWVVLFAPTVSVTGSINTAGGSKGGNTGAVYLPEDGQSGQTLIIQRRPTATLLTLLNNRHFVDEIKKVSAQTAIGRVVSAREFDRVANRFKRAA